MEAHWYQASTATYLFCIALVASGCCTFIVDYRLTVTSVVDMLSVSLSNYDDHNELATVHQAQHHRIKKNCLQKNMYIDLILTLNCSITHISLLVLMLHCTVYVQNNIFTSLPFRVFLVWLLFTPVYFCLKVNYDRQCNFMKLYAADTHFTEEQELHYEIKERVRSLTCSLRSPVNVSCTTL